MAFHQKKEIYEIKKKVKEDGNVIADMKMTITEN